MREERGVRTLARVAVLLTMVVLIAGVAMGQRFTHPQAGEVYKEYSRVMSTYAEWRVIDPNATNSGATSRLPNMVLDINLPNLNVGTPIKAEAVIDLWGGHAGTYGKKIRFNGNDWLDIPLIDLPSDPECYLYQMNVTVPIPLSHLQEGTNYFEGTNAGQTCFDFGWGQFGMNSIMIRVYYAPSSVSHPTGSITSPTSGGSISDWPTVTANASASAGVSKVDFIGYYNGLDLDGDGVYKDWHYYYHRGKNDVTMDIAGHIGTDNTAPYSAVWDTDLLPDQDGGAIKVQARIRDNNGMWYVTNAVDNISLYRDDHSVKLYVPYDIPGRFSVWAGRPWINAHINIPSSPSLSHMTNATVVISTFNGNDAGVAAGEASYLSINGAAYGTTAGYFGEDHFYDLSYFSFNPSNFQTGNNEIVLYSESHVTGFEVHWPGIQVVARYDVAPDPIELASFIATAVSASGVRLEWKTLSETNNDHFEVYRAQLLQGPFTKVGENIPGAGTTLVPQNYSYVDETVTPGEWYYKLKQVDLDGSFSYSEVQHVTVTLTSVDPAEVPTEAMLAQNFPNPFNPTTMIKYGLPERAHVTLTVYNTLGQPVATLVNGEIAPGYHVVQFDAKGLASGVYFYKIVAGNFMQTNKLLLLR
jgi:hypothetical protein